MNPKPMICKAPIVRNIMAGLKTRHRTPIRPQPHDCSPRPCGAIHVADYCTGNPELGQAYYWQPGSFWESTSPFFSPYQTGDTIWVRETWCGDCDHGPCYRENMITCAKPPHFPSSHHPWHPSIRMPKWACRLFLKVGAVRVERIRDISIEDCIAEGVGGEETPCPVRHDKMHSDAWYDGEGCEACGAPSVRELFRQLWDSLYPGSWARNDWVWVTEFERTERPEGWPHA